MCSLFDFVSNFMAFFFHGSRSNCFFFSISLLLVVMFVKKIMMIILIIIIIIINFIYLSGYLVYKVIGDTTKRNTGIKCSRL